MGTLAETRDIHLTTDMDLQGSEVTGSVAVVERVFRRLTTPRGMFDFWPNEGYDARDALLSKQPLWQIKFDMESEAKRDEEVVGCVVSLSIVSPATVMNVTVAIETEEGDYALVMNITTAAATLVSVQKLAA